MAKGSTDGPEQPSAAGRRGVTVRHRSRTKPWDERATQASQLVPQETAQPTVPPNSFADVLAVASINPAIATRRTNDRCGERRTVAMTNLGREVRRTLSGIIEAIPPIMQSPNSIILELSVSCPELAERQVPMKIQ